MDCLLLFTVMFHSFNCLVYLFAIAWKHNARFSSENAMMHCILKELEYLFLLLLSLNPPRFHTPQFRLTPHFPHSEHFLHSAFSTLRIFHTLHFLHAALRVFHLAETLHQPATVDLHLNSPISHRNQMFSSDWSKNVASKVKAWHLQTKAIRFPLHYAHTKSLITTTPNRMS